MPDAVPTIEEVTRALMIVSGMTLDDFQALIDKIDADIAKLKTERATLQFFLVMKQELEPKAEPAESSKVSPSLIEALAPMKVDPGRSMAALDEPIPPPVDEPIKRKAAGRPRKDGGATTLIDQIVEYLRGKGQASINQMSAEMGILYQTIYARIKEQKPERRMIVAVPNTTGPVKYKLADGV